MAGRLDFMGPGVDRKSRFLDWGIIRKRMIPLRSE